jgi:hypothetical protein
MLRVNVLIHLHTPGLRRDLVVLRSALEGIGCRVTVTPFIRQLPVRVARGIRKVGSSLFARPLYDINLFVEDAPPDWFHTARVNCLIPHQEWFRPHLEPLLPRFDWLLCKTRYAEQLFAKKTSRTRCIGFTTEDRGTGSYRPDYGAFLHMGGTSRQKGSSAVVRAWKSHPAWPLLHVVWHEETADVPPAENILWHRGFVPEMQLRELQIHCGIHVCPSEAEGYGHSLMEAMSCRAVPITTDAPPMNELVAPDRGILVPYSRTTSQGLGTNYYVDDQVLISAIEQLLALPVESRSGLGDRGRAFFEQEHAEFPTRLRRTLEEIS